MLTVSGGFQKTSYGLSDDFQTDTSFYCSSYSLGFGARARLSEAWSIDIAYFWTNYEDYEKAQTAITVQECRERMYTAAPTRYSD